MASSEDHDLVLLLKKAEWMEPRISTLVLDKTDGKFPLASERTRGVGAGWGGPGDSAGPS